MTVAELLNRVSSRELSEWVAFCNIEPFGFEADYLGHAQTSATLVNINRKKGTKQVSAGDFVPKFDKNEETVVDDAVNFAAALTTMHGGRVKRHGIS